MANLHNPLAVMQPGEQTLFELKRHPIGIVIIYVMTAIVLLALGIIGLVVAPGIATTGATQIRAFASIGLTIFGSICLLFNIIATIVYWGNRWILTSDSVTQISQTGLFHKSTSSLGLESLEDVTVDQNGILTRIFNYGTLTVETAGHHSKFVFPFAPNPNHYAQKILDASEKERLENNGRGDETAQSVPGPTAPGY